MKSTVWFGLLLALLAANVSGADDNRFLNLDFERVAAPDMPSGWGRYGPRARNFEYFVDDAAARSGTRSLRLRRTGPGPDGTSETVFPAWQAVGNRIRLMGYIRTADVVEGRAAIWLLMRKVRERSTIVALQDGPSGTTPWTRYSLDMIVPADMQEVRLGVSLSGSGTAWFDALSIEIDDKPYAQETSAPAPTDAQLSVLAASSSDLKSLDLRAADQDLVSLTPLVGQARIVGLGEASHGSREIFQLKNRTVAYLVQRLGFDGFALEASMPEARLIDKYVRGGDGDPRKLLQQLGFWTWYTQELLDLVEWLREYNRTADAKVGFWGIDCQMPALATLTVRQFVEKYEPDSRALLDRAYGPDSKTVAMVDKIVALRALEQRLQGVAAKYRAGEPSVDIEWTIQSARILRQSVEARDDALSRERCMADNIDWILARLPQSGRLVVWGHDDHLRATLIERARPTLGSILRDAYREKYVPIGYTFYAGDYLAAGPKGLIGYPAPTAPESSIEWMLHRLGRPLIVTDLRKAASERGGAWLSVPMDLRTVGAQQNSDQFVPNEVPAAFDGLIYTERSSPSTLMTSP
ncbi:MAG: erythromycin esterase family protein [Steroidobacteraceae bacterium]